MNTHAKKERKFERKTGKEGWGREIDIRIDPDHSHATAGWVKIAIWHALNTEIGCIETR